MNPLVSVIIVTYNRKQDALECVDSVLKSSYRPLEVMVVDNASVDGTHQALESEFGGRIKVVCSKENIYAGGGRNLGAREAKGQYLLFIDSDNAIDGDMITNLIKGISDNAGIKIGMCGPMNYCKSEPKRFCWVNNRISLWTSQTTIIGAGEIDNGQYNGLRYIKVHHIPNVFMLPGRLFWQIGGIDPVYVMHYEESDLAERIKRVGYEIVLFPLAKTWHNVTLDVKSGHKSFKGENPSMVYYVIRNRIFYMRKNSGGIRLFIFRAIFCHLFFIFNVFVLIKNR